MHRYNLLQMLERYLALYPNEQPMVARITALVEQHTDCFERTCKPGHITGSAWVVSSDHQQAALVHHRKLGKWLQPGGHADGDGDVVQVAWREATEETGLTDITLYQLEGTLVPLDVDVHEIPARYDQQGQLIEEAHEHHDIRFLFIAGANQTLVTSEESHAVEWFDQQELRDRIEEESVLRLIEKAAEWLA
ncbi:NUDIX hydrolase [Aeoliella mucimassa]|uniref:NUDIX domain protein n=1 Tax=Aeoliella mucimassa TaxID=2527972 RepID=A0A518AIG3_9BACT|nr:NUDIX hydrolase [Aeoliella mucimassa]QDU54506.1 NUDIX domain protein [Aeoliella mucimassa]